jgi:hypothetical protein
MAVAAPGSFLHSNAVSRSNTDAFAETLEDGDAITN